MMFVSRIVLGTLVTVFSVNGLLKSGKSLFGVFLVVVVESFDVLD
jgi:hypothetical protein